MSHYVPENPLGAGPNYYLYRGEQPRPGQLKSLPRSLSRLAVNSAIAGGATIAVIERALEGKPVAAGISLMAGIISAKLTATHANEIGMYLEYQEASTTRSSHF